MESPRTAWKPRLSLAVLCLALALVTGACSDDDPALIVRDFLVNFDPTSGTGTLMPDGGVADTPLESTFAWNQNTRTLTITIDITNNSDRLLFNPKLVVTGLPAGVAFNNPDGDLDGDEFRYYGPTALAQLDTSFERDLEFDVPDDVPLMFSITLVTHPSLFTSCSWGDVNGGVSVIDVGQNLEVDTITADIDPDRIAWYSVLSPSARYLYVSCRGNEEGGPGAVLRIDTTTNAVDMTFEAQAAEAGEYAEMGGLAVSGDGSMLYVCGREAATQWSGNSDGTPMLYLVDTMTMSESARITLAGEGRCNDVLLDEGAGRLYVAMLDQQGVTVIDTATRTQIDTDGDGGNGATPVAMPYAKPGGLEMDPAGGKIWVSFSQNAASAVASFNTTTFAIVDDVASTIAGDNTRSGPNLEFGPLGRLFVPRTQYDRDGAEEGLTIFDLAADTETQVATPADGNNDNWDVAFWVAGDRCYISQSDAGEVAVIDLATNERIDTDGDAGNGITNIVSALQGFYGGAMTITPW